MKKIVTYSFILSAMVATFTGCKKNNNSNPATTDKIAPDGFKYATSNNVTINLALRAPNNDPLPGVIVSVYDPNNVTDGAALIKGATDASGNLKLVASVPSYLTTLVIDPAYVGLIRNATAAISNNTITATIGGKTGFSGSIVPEKVSFSTGGSTSGGLRVNDVTLTVGFPAPYGSLAGAVVNSTDYPSNLGRPAYLLNPGDVVPTSLLSFVNSSLPEGTPLTQTHPAYLTNGTSSIINVTATADVWVTFVSEGAGYKNALAYYTYPTNTPPQTVANITNATYIFPNASALGSGGGMLSGDKVLLGRFNAGTSIGYVLLQNAFLGASMDATTPKFFPQDNLNPETDQTLQHHVVTLYDDVNKLFVTGFEDLNRQVARPGTFYASDNDFNDLVIYTTSNPVVAISTVGLPIVDKGADTDGDGVADVLDAFPNDPTRAYITYYPSASTYAQIAFEDNWPLKGDYDMNDLVVNYRYTFISNARNQVVTMQGDYTVAAAGATYRNGFGVQLPVGASAVSSVTGQKAISNYITMASNGVEAGQTKAVIIPFDNFNAIANNADNSSFINTLTAKDKVTSTTASVLVTFASPVDQSVLNATTLNPFLISNLRRGYEVHLPGFAPTDKATTSLFGTNDDASVVANGTTYISKQNWPWAINYSGTFSYALEGVSIATAYPHFLDWAASGGTSFNDWYYSTLAGFRDLTKLYTK